MIGISELLVIHSVIGLACWLFTSRSVLREYENITPKFRNRVICISFITGLIWEIVVSYQIVKMIAKFFFYPKVKGE